MTTGTIKKVVSDRGFGFIAAEDGKEYFFHRDGLTSSLDFDRLAGGEKVQFDDRAEPQGRSREERPERLTQARSGRPLLLRAAVLFPATRRKGPEEQA